MERSVRANGDAPMPDVDVTVAHPARMYDYYLGGITHFAADREAARRVLAMLPEGRAMALANRAFLRRAVRFLAAQGITQFLDIGIGIPSPGSTGEVLRELGHEARVVYADNDPIVVTHSRALLSDVRGSDHARVVYADVREPERLLDAARVFGILDFSKPIAVLLVAVLHFITDDEDPDALLAVLKAALPAGSYLVISQGTGDFDPERAATAAHGYDEAATPFVVRTRGQVGRFFGGLTLIEPGLVQLPYWRPDGDVSPRDAANIWLYAGVARKD